MFVQSVAFGWKNGVGAIHLLGLHAGLGHRQLGPAYVTEILEPTLQSAEARIARHIEKKDLAECDVRHATPRLRCSHRWCSACCTRTGSSEPSAGPSTSTPFSTTT